MPRKSIIIIAIALTIACFIAGWLSHEWAIDNVTTKIEQKIIYNKVHGMVTHRLITSLSMALVGATIGLGTLLIGRFSTEYRYGRSLYVLIPVAAIGASSWMVVLTNKITTLGQRLAMPVSVDAALDISVIHLYEIGIFASSCVLAVAIILAILPLNKNLDVNGVNH